jgi:inorganic pyrophosphatase
MALSLRSLRPLVADHLHWTRWEDLIAARGLTIDRPAETAHPDYPEVIYPLDYGYVNGTVGTDGDPVDAFVGRADTGLVGCILTTDLRQEDREAKLLVDCTPAEVYCAHGFINYDRALLRGVLVMRRPMRALWADVGVSPT